MTAGGTPVLHSLEEFYAAPVEDVAKRLRNALSAIGPDTTLMQQLDTLRCREFLDLYLDQIQTVPVNQWLDGLDLGAGSLRASIIGRELASAPDHSRRSVLMDGELMSLGHLPIDGLPPRQVKAALCYATEILAEDPFDEEQNVKDFIRAVNEIGLSPLTPAPDPHHFVSTVEAIAALGPIIRAGYVKFIPRRAAMSGDLMGLFASSTWDTEINGSTQSERRARELSKRTLRLWLTTGGAVTPLFEDDREESAFRAEAGLLAPCINETEAVRLRQLSRLTLPTAGGLSPGQMVKIREDDTFATFRSRQRQALAATGAGADEADVRLFQEEMTAAAQDLRKQVRSSIIQGLVTRTIGWGVGAMILAPESLQAVLAALGGIASQILVERVVKGPANATRALHHHYAVLGGDRTNSITDHFSNKVDPKY